MRLTTIVAHCFHRSLLKTDRIRTKTVYFDETDNLIAKPEYKCTQHAHDVLLQT